MISSQEDNHNISASKKDVIKMVESDDEFTPRKITTPTELWDRPDYLGQRSKTSFLVPEKQKEDALEKFNSTCTKLGAFDYLDKDSLTGINPFSGTKEVVNNNDCYYLLVVWAMFKDPVSGLTMIEMKCLNGSSFQESYISFANTLAEIIGVKFMDGEIKSHQRPELEKNMDISEKVYDQVCNDIYAQWMFHKGPKATVQDLQCIGSILIKNKKLASYLVEKFALEIASHLMKLSTTTYFEEIRITALSALVCLIEYKGLYIEICHNIAKFLQSVKEDERKIVSLLAKRGLIAYEEHICLLNG
jgi:hypothetical protein